MSEYVGGIRVLSVGDIALLETDGGYVDRVTVRSWRAGRRKADVEFASGAQLRVATSLLKLAP
jgi:hypothetical protein